MSMSMSSSSTSACALRLSSSMVRVSPNCNSSLMMATKKKKKTTTTACPMSLGIRSAKSKNMIRCEVAINAVEESSLTKIGARVKVKVPLKVYHVPKVGEIDLNGMEGEIKQYVALWKGKRISANLPYKVEFVTDIQGRGPVKFFAHLKEDEFEHV